MNSSASNTVTLRHQDKVSEKSTFQHLKKKYPLVAPLSLNSEFLESLNTSWILLHQDSLKRQIW